MDTAAVRAMLVGVGDEGLTDQVLGFATAAAVEGGHELVFVHAISPPPGFAGPAGMFITSEGFELVAEELVRDAADRARAIVGDRVQVRGVTRPGLPSDVLVELGRDADRIVLQRHHLSVLHRIATGSVGAAVAARATVPVVEVPQDWTPSTSGIPRVVVGFEDDHHDTDLVAHAFQVAERLGATLTFVHAWHLSSMYDDVITDHADRNTWSERARARLVLALEPMHLAHPGVEVHVEVDHLPTADALVLASDKADLLLLGRHRTLLHFPHLGSLSRAVIRESRCPVEVVPAQRHAPGAVPDPLGHSTR